MEFERYRKAILEKLSPQRYQHSLQVVDTALKMAQNLQLNTEQVYLAALLHDYAKDMAGELLLAIAREKGLLTCHVEEVQPDLLHGSVGAWLCEYELGIQDPEVLHAIRYHTTGNVQMSSLEVIIYLADLIEPGRNYEGVKELRDICQQDLEAGLLFAFDATLKYVLKRKMLIHPQTVEARNWLLLRGDTPAEEIVVLREQECPRC